MLPVRQHRMLPVRAMQPLSRVTSCRFTAARRVSYCECVPAQIYCDAWRLETAPDGSPPRSAISGPHITGCTGRMHGPHCIRHSVNSCCSRAHLQCLQNPPAPAVPSSLVACHSGPPATSGSALQMRQPAAAGAATHLASPRCAAPRCAVRHRVLAAYMSRWCCAAAGGHPCRPRRCAGRDEHRRRCCRSRSARPVRGRALEAASGGPRR